MKYRVLGLVAVLSAMAATATQAPASVRSASERSLRAPHTTAPDLYINVRVTMTNDKFIVSRHSAPRGADARFIIKNISNKVHIFAIGNEKYGTGAQTGFSSSVKPGQQRILILFLDYRGTISYHGGLPADRNKPGMKGKFDIGPCTKFETTTGTGNC